MRILWTVLVLLLVCTIVSFAQTGSEPQQPSSTAAPSGPPSDQKPTPSAATQGGLPDSTQLVVVKFVKPVYPEAARREQIQGEVMVRLAITPGGDVENATSISGNPLLAAAVVDAMKQWKFQPYIRNGQAVRVTTNQRYDFAFSDKVTDISPKGATSSPPPAASSANAMPTDEGTQQRVRVSKDVAVGMLIHKVIPVYPRKARENGIQGTVVLKALIGKDGLIKELKVVSGPEELAPAAISAVQQWRYRPYFLKGEPVEVATTINVNFQLKSQ
ncbi:MAG: energy transducer TonB [Terriglobales bacterium]